MWVGTAGGVVRYRPSRDRPSPPEITVLADRPYALKDTIPPLPKGGLVGFEYRAVDVGSPVSLRRYRHTVLSGKVSAEEAERQADWSAATRDTSFEWPARTSGTFTFAVQYIDRDLNYSRPAVAVIAIAPLWYQNPKIMLPAGGVGGGFLVWFFIARALYVRKRREAERLRGQLYEEEHRARAAAEKARVEIEAKNAQLIEAKEAADGASRAKSVFLANMSHELRTPLTAIIGFSEMLLADAKAQGRSEQEEDLGRVYDSAQHLLGLINGILDLSKIEAQKMELHLDTFDVGQLVGDVARTLEPLIRKNGNTFRLDCPADLGPMRADPVKLRQCLINLLSNASKFTEKGTVTLQARRNPGSPVQPQLAPDTIQFQVSDTGIGMTPEQLAQLFRAFEQVHGAGGRKYGGTGLGLVITQHFCEMMGGSMRVESRPNQGSTFTIELPLAVVVRSSGASDRAAGPGPAPGPGDQACVLVIDDDPNVHRLIERILRNEQLEVRFASDGVEGLRLARELHPAVITLDVLMPHTDGWSTLSALKADADLASIPVIMLSVLGESEVGFALGASDYLLKPIDRDRLVGALKHHLPDSNAGTVLIVEDDADLRSMLRRMLQTERWAVAEAEHGRAALAVLEDRPVSVILLDLMMPVMDGFQFLAELQAREEWRTIPVVVITAMELSEGDRARLRQQTERIVEKGAFFRDGLLREVRECVRRYHAPPNPAAAAGANHGSSHGQNSDHRGH